MKAERHQISNQITEGVIWKQLLFFFFPILFGTFFQQLYNTTDAVIVGRCEADGAYGNGALRRGRGCDHGAWDALLGCGAPRDEHA